MGFIYKITNLITKKLYIGQTKQKDPQYRWIDHIRTIKYGNGCPLLTASAKKYGIENFKFEVIIICFDEDLNKYEIEYIKKYNTITPNGYNVSDGGHINNGFKNKRHSEETKQKLREIVLKRFQDPNELLRHRQCIQKFYDNDGIAKSKKWKEALERRKLHKNECKARGTYKKKGALSQELKNRISKSVKEYFNNEDIRNKHSQIMVTKVGRKISQYTKDDIFIKQFNSIKEGAIYNKISEKGISACLNGRSNTSGGFKWKYIDI